MNVENPTILQSMISEAVDTLKLQLEAVNDQYEQSAMEQEALRDGIIVWKDVCIIVDTMENAIQRVAMESSVALTSSLHAGTNSESFLSSANATLTRKIIQALKEANNALEDRLDLAVKNNWSLLVVAISHELEASKRALEMVQKRIKTSKLAVIADEFSSEGLETVTGTPTSASPRGLLPYSNTKNILEEAAKTAADSFVSSKPVSSFKPLPVFSSSLNSSKAASRSSTPPEIDAPTRGKQRSSFSNTKNTSNNNENNINSNFYNSKSFFENNGVSRIGSKFQKMTVDDSKTK